MDFCDAKISLPDGETTHWDLIRHSGGAAVLPVDRDGLIILVRQFRLGANRALLEIPAGKSEPGEDALTTIRREMEEEIGYISGNICRLMDFYPAPAYSEEKTVIYIATDLKPTGAHPDGDEFLHIERYPTEELIRMVDSGEIVDGKTIAALLRYKVGL